MNCTALDPSQIEVVGVHEMHQAYHQRLIVEWSKRCIVTAQYSRHDLLQNLQSDVLESGCSDAQLSFGSVFVSQVFCCFAQCIEE